MLFVISAPSGAGKTTIIRGLFNILPGLRFSVSATTRLKRKIEKEGKDYYFITEADFTKKVENGEFVEWEEVHGKMYGTLKSEIEKNINSPLDVIFDVDVKGALNIKKLYPQSVTIYIDAPMKDIISRLRKRSTETEEEIKKRLERLELELTYREKFDYIVQNSSEPGGIDRAVNDITEIITKSKL